MDNSQNNRIKGALVGVAVGDSLGATLEFQPMSKNWDDHKEIIGGGTFQWDAGDPTDDTDMTLCVARAIIQEPRNPFSLMLDYFDAWYSTNPIDVGTTVAHALDYGTELAHKMLKGRTAGNGSLMRTAPVACAYYSDIAVVRQMAMTQSTITHYSKEASLACAHYSELLALIISNPPYSILNKKALVSHVLKHTSYGEIELSYLKREDMNPSGYVVDSFICALWAFISTNNFEDAVVLSVNLGGDADTIGAITGGLAGAYYGFDNIPLRWVNKTKVSALLIHMADNIALFEGRGHI